jgi:hypothetical protein
LTDKGSDILNHNWQRWFSDLYLYVKTQESTLSSVATTTDLIINGGGVVGAVGPKGDQGLAGDQGMTGLQGIQGMTGLQGIQGVTGLLQDVLADGGFANSVYLPSQHLDGGGA